MKYKNVRKINGDYFLIQKGKVSYYKVENLSDFNINYYDYIILKSSNKPRIVSLKDFLEFKHSEYLFIKKDIFNEDDFNFWMGSDFTIRYLHKPLPSKSLYKKIIIIKK